MPRLSLILSLLLALTLHAQKGNKEPLLWSDGPLEFEQINVWLRPSESSFMNYRLSLKASREHIRDSVFGFERVLNEFTGVHPDSIGSDDPQRLLYFQLGWDIFELYRRKAQLAVFREPDYEELERIVNYQMLQAYLELNKYNTETRYGKDSKALRRWEYELRNSLMENPSPAHPTYVGTTDLGLDFGIGTSFIAPFGQGSQYYSAIPGISGFLGFNYQNLEMRLRGSAGRTRSLEILPYPVAGPANQVTDVGQYSIGISYVLREGNRFSLKPYLGFGSMIQEEASAAEAQFGTFIEQEVTQSQLIIGIDFDFDLMKYFVNHKPFLLFEQAEQETLKINTLLFMAYNLDGPIQGGFVGLDITISLEARGLIPKP